MKKPKSLKKVLQEIIESDPKAHYEAVARAYGIESPEEREARSAAKYRPIEHGERVHLLERAYHGGLYEGTLVLSEGERPASRAYGVHTIRLDDGRLFRTEGYLARVP